MANKLLARAVIIFELRQEFAAGYSTPYPCANSRSLNFTTTCHTGQILGVHYSAVAAMK